MALGQGGGVGSSIVCQSYLFVSMRTKTVRTQTVQDRIGNILAPKRAWIGIWTLCWGKTVGPSVRSGTQFRALQLDNGLPILEYLGIYLRVP